jgi:putative redox protein
MKLDLHRLEAPFIMELRNDQGNSCFMDANPSIGGGNKGFRPMELLAGSLAGCVSIDVLNIVKKQRIDLKHYNVRIEAKRVEGTPAPFEHIHLIFEFDDCIDLVKMQRNIELTLEKYCSVSACLKEEIKVTYALEIK